MSSQPRRTYAAQEFARLAGVTVRALHHYDRLGLLLTPARSSAGYRVYSDADLRTLEQIVVLRFIGIPLQQIASLRQAGPTRFIDGLRAQRGTLERKRQLLDDAIASIGRLELAAAAGGPIDPAIFKRIFEVITMQNNPHLWKKHYDDLVSRKIERLRSLSPEALTALRSDWRELVAEIRALALEEKESRTSSPGVFEAKAQAVATRWEQLLGVLMGGPVQVEALASYQTSQEWTPQMASFVDKPVWDFMQEVFKRRRTG